ncbi:substrate-binding periplasmic protein [Rugamonas aquatica]|uniref:substrate-binding periplasmic protein n=1 Tax=Rugamonas aquatica TaxID=2743357 RepID=UPI0015816E1D|nr:transporter substrate-binding domain-containing protein [Rugamonas aquatica]
MINRRWLVAQRCSPQQSGGFVPGKSRLAAVLLFACGFAHAGAYRCVSLNYPPLIQQDAGRPVHGLAVDIVTSVMASLGHTVSVEILPWGRALALMRQGERDCIFTIFQSPEREHFLDFSRESLIPQIIYFYARDDNSARFDGDFAALAGLRVGTVLSVNYGARFEAARPQLAIREVPTLEQNFRKLTLGRVDLIPSNMYTASYTLDKLLGAELAGHIVKLPQAIDSVPSYIAFAKGRQLAALRDQFDRGLRALIASGEYRRLLERYRIEWTPELSRQVEGR